MSQRISINKYNELKKELRDLKEVMCDFARSCCYRNTVSMFYYPKEKLNSGWNLLDLNERTKAAEQLGYEVILKSKDIGLHVEYVKKIPKYPVELTY